MTARNVRENMINSILIIWFILLLIFLGIPGLYYLYLKKYASKPWNIKIDTKYAPPITIMVPMHNEEQIIQLKLENLYKVKYPKEKIQLILIDDASTDKTLQKVHNFIEKNNKLDTQILSEKEHKGKSYALNLALKYAKHNVIVMSDADSFWSPAILKKAMPFLADDTVGAIIGQESILNPEQSWVTQGEKTYVNLVNNVIRLGESKIHSNIFFHGLFAVYKRKYLQKFNTEIDDSGTALDIVQMGVRTLSIPDAACFDMFPITWRNKIAVKTRRASQLIQICFRCLKLLVKGKLQLPKKIAIPEIFLYLFNPVIFVILIIFTLVIFIEFLPFSLILLLPTIIIFSISKLRNIIMEILFNYSLLAMAFFIFLSGRQFIVWETLDEPRLMLTRNILEKEKLV